MPKLTLSTVSSLANQTAAITTINNNFAAIVAQIDLLVSRDGEAPNTMLAALDMNSQRINNLPNSVNAGEPFTHGQALAHLPNITTVAGAIANINAIGSDLLGANNIGTVAANLNGANTIGTVATNIATVSAVGTNIAAITGVNTNMASILSVFAALTNINTVAGSIANINTVASAIANVNSVAGNATNINSVAGGLTNINTVATSIANVNTVATNIANIASVVAALANINSVAGGLTNINTVAGSIANVNTTATNIANVNTVATNISAINGVSALATKVEDFVTTLENVPIPSPSATPVTFNPATAVNTGTDVITITAHGYYEGQLLYYTHGGGTAIGGLTTATLYYAKTVTTNTFQLSATRGGAAINLTSVGAGTAHTFSDVFSLIHYAEKARQSALDAQSHEVGAAQIVAAMDDFTLGSYANAAAAWANPNAIANFSIYYNTTNSDWRVLGASAPLEGVLGQYSSVYDALLTALNSGVLPTGVIASQAEAEAGSNNTKGMTPLRVAQAIAALGGAGVTIASQAEAEAGVENTKMITPLRAAQAIAALTPAPANNSITFAKIQDISTDVLIGRDTAASGDPEEITVGGGLEFTGTGGIQRSALTGDVTASAGSNATTIANGAVTYAKMQNVSATTRFLGRTSAGAGVVEEITASQLRTMCNLVSGTNFEAYSSTVATGIREIFIPASAMTARTTAGAGAGSAESSTNKIMQITKDFDQTTQEYAQFIWIPPKSWDLGTVTFIPWCIPAGSSGGWVFSLAGVSISNDEVIDTAFGTAQTSTDSFLASTDVHVGPESAAITIANTPAASDIVIFQVSRVVGDGSDTHNGDVKLLGIKLRYTINAKTDA